MYKANSYTYMTLAQSRRILYDLVLTMGGELIEIAFRVIDLNKKEDLVLRINLRNWLSHSWSIRVRNVEYPDYRRTGYIKGDPYGYQSGMNITIRRIHIPSRVIELFLMLQDPTPQVPVPIITGIGKDLVVMGLEELTLEIVGSINLEVEGEKSNYLKLL